MDDQKNTATGKTRKFSPGRFKSLFGSKQSIVFILLFGVIGAALLFKILASGYFVALEAETGTINSPAAVVNDTSASGGKALQFNASPTTHTCHTGDPLSGVQDPGRLGVTKLCQTVTGTVCQLEFSETDGDKAFDLLVDAQYKSLLKSTNVNQCAQVDSRLALHLETIPQGHLGSVFYSPVAESLALKVGDYVSVTGPLVQDNGHGGWTEIHPVEFIDVITHSTMAQPAPAAPSTAKEP